MLLIGSQALIKDGYNLRKPLDYDLIVTPGEIKSLISNFKMPVKHISGNKFLSVFDNLPVELEVAFKDTSAEDLLQANYNVTAQLPFGQVQVADINTLLLLKQSHRFLKNSPHFLKTMRDIHFLRGIGAKIGVDQLKLLKKRELETYTYAHPSLKQNKDTFFQEHESFYIYDHDSLHRAVAIDSKPAYTFYIQEGAEVNCSKELFFSLPEEVRLNGVLEEAYVLALERSQIPFNFSIEPRASFLLALEKVCTSITSGWFREFAWENYDRVLSLYSDDYVSHFDSALRGGKIEKFKKTT